MRRGAPLDRARGGNRFIDRKRRVYHGAHGVSGYGLGGGMPMSSGDVRNVTPEEALRLVRDNSVRILDVRTSGEYERLGHIPGAMLLPVDLIAVAPATLPADDRPLLVICEHGVRSAHAAVFLARAGFHEVINMTGGMARWNGPRDHHPGSPFVPHGPSSWVVEKAGLMKRGGRALDVACGRGRHALLMAMLGMHVDAVDRDEGACAALGKIATRLGLDVRPIAADLESGAASLPVETPSGSYDLCVVVNYLHRPLFPALVSALRPRGVLIYETFLRGNRSAGGPSNPDYLLEPGELPRLMAGMRILDQREGEFEGRRVSAVAAIRD